MREMKDSGIEWIKSIPMLWNVHPIYYYFIEHKQRNYFGDESNLLSLSYGRIVRKDINTSEGLLPENFNGYNIVSKGDIVLRLTDLQNDKRSLRTGLVKERGIITSAYVTIRPKKQINSNYFYYLLYAYDVVKVLYNMGNGVRQGLNYGELSKLHLIEPPLSEQHRIASFLDAKCAEIDALTADIQEQIDTLEQYKRSVITVAVTKGLNPDVEMKDSGIEWIGKIPAHWNLSKIGYVVKSICDIDHYMPKGVDEGVPYLMIGDLEQLISKVDFETCKKISYDDYSFLARKSKPKCGDIIMARYATIGTVSYVDIDKDFLVSYACVTVHPASCVIGKYLYYYMMSYAFFEEVKRYINTNTQGNIGKETLSRVKIALPPCDEQKNIIKYLDSKCIEIERSISKKQEQLSILDEYKKSLIFEYVTGKKEV